MRQIRYNDNTNVIKFFYPSEWDPALITAVEVSITDSDGTEILAADDATLYTATELDGDVARFAGTITLDGEAETLEIGDQLRIVGTNGAETLVVKGYDSTNKIVTIEGTLENAYSDGDPVYACFATYTIDTTTVADFPAGLVVTILWTPTGSGQPLTELAQIAKSAFDLTGFERDFRDLYPRAYDDMIDPTDKFSRMLEQAEKRVESDLFSKNLDLQRVVDTSKLQPLVMSKLAYMWTLNGDSEKSDEYEKYKTEYDSEFDRVLQWPIWVDSNQDLTEDDGETTNHPHIFIGSW